MSNYTSSDLYKVASLHEQPEYVKQASAADFGLDKPLMHQHYADGAGRQYPMHTRAATWASIARLMDKRAELEEDAAALLEEQLSKRASFFGMDADVGKLVESQARQETPAELKNEDYAYVVKQGGVETRHYPLRHQADVDAAVAYIHKHRKTLSYPERRMMARRILNKAAALQILLKEDDQYFLDKQAARGTCPTEKATGLLEERLAMIGPEIHPEAKDLITKLAAAVQDQTDVDGYDWTRDRLAEAVYLIDKEAGLTRYYGKELEYPEDELFSVTTQKVASFVEEMVETQTGDVYSRKDLCKLGYDQLQETLGEDLANACLDQGVLCIEKLAALLPTLPRPDARRFAQDMEELGIDKTASVPNPVPRMTHTDWINLAAETA